MQIQYTNKIDLSNGVKSVVFGPSGVGKTTLIATAPRPFILSAERGLLSLRKVKVPYIEITGIKELYEAYNFVTKSAEFRNYDTLGLDSLSEIAEVIQADQKKRDADARKYVSRTADDMYGLIRTLRDLPRKHVVCLAKQMLVDTSSLITGPQKTASPIMPGEKLQNNLPYFWDGVLHMDIMQHEGKNYRVLHTQVSPYWLAKDRSGMLDAIEPPDLTHLFKKAMS